MIVNRRSTITAVIDFMVAVLTAYNGDECLDTVLSDLIKVYDTVSHKILLEKFVIIKIEETS